MKNAACLLAVLASALCGAAQTLRVAAQKPQQVTFSSITSEELIGLCKTVEGTAQSDTSLLCLTYISAFTDGYNVAMARFNKEKQAGFCPPQEVTRQQMAKVIVKYGTDHPNQLWVGGALFTALAFKDAYPCQE